MITVTSISKLRNCSYDEIWAVVRSLKNKSSILIQHSELSPSPSLYGRFLTEKKAGRWDTYAFSKWYTPVFLKEIAESANARASLNELYRRSRNGENIALACFCTDERLCHRSILAGLLQGAGADVKTERGDYTRYYKMFKDLR